ncbi:MAG: DUF6868 family protein [Gammaproteobacteria bacterium]
MITIEVVSEFLGWSTVINFGVLVIITITLVLMRNSISKIHARMFGLSDTDISRAYFQYLAQYKIAVFIFNLIPYIALKIMT